MIVEPSLGGVMVFRWSVFVALAALSVFVTADGEYLLGLVICLLLVGWGRRFITNGLSASEFLDQELSQAIAGASTPGSSD